MKVRESLSKKMKRFNIIKNLVDSGLITSTVITSVVFIDAFERNVGMPVGIALSGNCLFFSLVAKITRRPFKIFSVKQENHDAFKLLALSKLRSIPDIISQAMQYGGISPIEFHKVLQEGK